MRDRRSEPRKTRFASVEICWEAGSGSLRWQSAVMENMSPSGMGLRTRESLPLGTKMQIKTRNQAYSATVRSCYRLGFEYFIGVQLIVVAAAEKGEEAKPSSAPP
jgi:hypothetical protein